MIKIGSTITFNEYIPRNRHPSVKPGIEGKVLDIIDNVAMVVPFNSDMSTELQEVANFALTRFSGGEQDGVCVQVTQLNQDRGRGESTAASLLRLQRGEGNPFTVASFVQMTREQARELGQALLDFAEGNEMEMLE